MVENVIKVDTTDIETYQVDLVGSGYQLEPEGDNKITFQNQIEF